MVILVHLDSIKLSLQQFIFKLRRLTVPISLVDKIQLTQLHQTHRTPLLSKVDSTVYVQTSLPVWLEINRKTT